MEIAAGTTISAANCSGPTPRSSCSASRLVRFETGSSSDAVLAIHTVVSANGSGDKPTCLARITTTGVNSTAVVSSERKIVPTIARASTRSQSNHALPRPQRAVRSAITLNRPASAASSVTTVIAITKNRMGQTLLATARASAIGRIPSAIATNPTTSNAAPRMAVRTASFLLVSRLRQSTICPDLCPDCAPAG